MSIDSTHGPVDRNKRRPLDAGETHSWDYHFGPGPLPPKPQTSAERVADVVFTTDEGGGAPKEDWELAVDQVDLQALVGNAEQTSLATTKLIEELKASPEFADAALQKLASFEDEFTPRPLRKALLVSARQQIQRIGLGRGSKNAQRPGDNDVWLSLVDDVVRSANWSHPTAAIDARSDLTIFLKAHPDRKGEALDRLKKGQMDPVSSTSTKAGIQMSIRDIKDSVPDLSPQIGNDDGLELETPGEPL